MPAAGKTRRGGTRSGPAGDRIRGAALALAVTLALLTGIIRGFAGSGALFLAEMRRLAPPERTGLPEAEYPGMAAHIADYLAGRKDSFQYSVSGEGGESLPCFHEYEIAHMRDCRGLIRLDGLVCAACLAAVLWTAGSLRLRLRKAGQDARERRRAAARGAGYALLGLSLIAAAMLLWAVIDFDGLFITFHRVAFTNELWLLNPRTDLLIRLMPEAMFVDLGVKGLGLFAAGMAAFICAGAALAGKQRRDG